MKNIISKMDGKFLKELRLTNDQVIDMLNEDKAILLDVRYPFETKVWGFSFTKNIPINQLQDNIDKLPKDKTIICACPGNTRATIACMYLLSEGFDVKISDEGLIALTSRLKGGSAKDLKL
jgi:rhodanese-related sulfurtransferase